MTKEEIEELEMLSEKLHRLDEGRGIALPKTIEQADTLIGLIARFNYLQGKKEDHDKACEVFNLAKNEIKDSWGMTGCSGLGGDSLFTLLDKILEKLQS